MILKHEDSCLEMAHHIIKICFLSAGTDGIDVFYKNGRLHAEARAMGRMWNVSSGLDYLQSDVWNTIIVAWSPT